LNYDLAALEFDGIRRLLEGLAATPYGADAARGLESPPNVEVARQMQRAVSAARYLLESQRTLRIDSLANVRPSLRQVASPGGTLSAKALANLLQVMDAAAKLHRWVSDEPALYPGDARHLLADTALQSLLQTTVSASGALRDDASESLTALWHAQRSQSREVEKLLKAMMQRDDVRHCLRDESKVIWQGTRAMLAVKADKTEQIRGVRRGSHYGGRDALIEPLEAVALNNQLERTSQSIGVEQQKLLCEISAQVQQHIDALEKMLDAITWIDLAIAAAQLSIQTGSHAPELLDESCVELNQAYHPQLLLQFIQGVIPRPVPITLHLNGEQGLLLITGPNTGGKTVALKTLGLLVLMAQCGLHIPAEHDCRIGWYDAVMVDMGDRQSLYHQLSTFAGHVEAMKRILNLAGEHSLLLLDELGTGTDPDEGAALAMAILDELIARRCQGLVNTHLSPLKDYAAQQQYIQNAAMVFDPKTLSPTYELQIGASGVSLGLIIAERNGLPAGLVARARDYLKQIES